MIINPVPFSGTTSDGAWTGDTPYIEGILNLVSCKFNTATTTFDFKITKKANGVPIFKGKDIGAGDEEGEMAESPNISVRGIYTITIANASKDETFEGELGIRE